MGSTLRSRDAGPAAEQVAEQHSHWTPGAGRLRVPLATWGPSACVARALCPSSRSEHGRGARDGGRCAARAAMRVPAPLPRGPTRTHAPARGHRRRPRGARASSRTVDVAFNSRDNPGSYQRPTLWGKKQVDRRGGPARSRNGRRQRGRGGLPTPGLPWRPFAPKRGRLRPPACCWVLTWVPTAACVLVLVPWALPACGKGVLYLVHFSKIRLDKNVGQVIFSKASSSRGAVAAGVHGGSGNRGLSCAPSPAGLHLKPSVCSWLYICTRAASMSLSGTRGRCLAST